MSEAKELETIRPVYQFSFTDDNYITYVVYFLNENAEATDATDHAAPHEIRREFVRHITRNFDFPALDDLWFDLPDLPFTDHLRRNGFCYKQFSVLTDGDYLRIYIQ